MKKVAFGLLTLLLMVYACKSGVYQSTEKEKLTLQNSSVNAFSDTTLQDTFKVAYSGNSSKDGAIDFTIINSKGQQIYNTKIKTADLLKGNTKLKTEEERMDFISNEIKYFFDEEHFLSPAVMPDENADANVPDKAFYDELKINHLDGFIYRTGVEAKRYIAWSIKEGKVKIYYQLD